MQLVLQIHKPPYQKFSVNGNGDILFGQPADKTKLMLHPTGAEDLAVADVWFVLLHPAVLTPDW